MGHSRRQMLLLALIMLLGAGFSEVTAAKPFSVSDFKSSDSKGRWAEIMQVAEAGFDALEREKRNEPFANLTRARFFDKAASMAATWKDVYYPTWPDHVTADYVYVLFSGGLFWELAGNNDEALGWYRDAERALRQLRRGTPPPMYNGKPISELLPDRIVAVSNPTGGTQISLNLGASWPPTLMYDNRWNVDHFSRNLSVPHITDTGDQRP